MVPWLGGKLPAMTFIRVDLPAPLSPIRPSTSPRSSAIDTSLRAWMAPKLLDMSTSSRTGTRTSTCPGQASDASAEPGHDYCPCGALVTPADQFYRLLRHGRRN